jgi:geranylgeranyl diphosphate synthase type II
LQLSLLRQRIENEIDNFNKELSLQTDQLNQPIQYFLKIGGKRMRPILVLMANQVFSGNIEKAIKPALAIELFHNFTLMHDDIMDKASLRRGQSTVHTKWNENIAILCGDALMIESYRLLESCDDAIYKLVMKSFSKTASEVCIGQQLDMDFENSTNVSIEQYLEMIKLKTAVLLGCAMKIGAYTAHITDERANLIEQFAIALGVSFQIDDDILDCFGEEELVGKLKGGDIVANKKTLLMLLAIQSADNNTKAKIDALMNNQYEPTQKVGAMLEIYEQLEVRIKAEAYKNSYFESAKHALNQLQLPTEQYQLLLAFAESLMNRKF